MGEVHEKKGMEVPVGYMVDGKGNLVNKKNVKPLDLKRDALVKKLYKRAEALHEQNQAFRQEALDEIARFIAESGELHGVKLGGTKGNVVLTSFDGSIRVQRAIGERMAFTEELEVARTLVYECLREFAKGANKNLQALVESAFAMDEKGNVSVREVVKLKNVKIVDEKWERAMRIITGSIQVVSSKEYMRFHKRNEHDEYVHVNMNFSG